MLKLTKGVGEEFFSYCYEQARAGRRTLGTVMYEGWKARFAGGPALSARRAAGLVGKVLAWTEEIDVPAARPEGGWGAWLSNLPPGPLGTPDDALKAILLDIDKVGEPKLTLEQYMNQLAPLAKDLAQAQSRGVRVMTMAASKGLTVEATIVAAVEEGIVPRPDADRDEERRLLYVAMTRAKRFLYCTWAGRRKGPTVRSGQPRQQQWLKPSGFLMSGPVATEDGRAYITRRWSDDH